MKHLSLLLCLLLLPACRNGGVESPRPDAPTALIQDLDIYRASVPEEGLIAAGQLTEKQVDALLAAGYTEFINLRVETEPGTGWEADYLGERGGHYANFPIGASEDFNEMTVRAIDSLIGGPERKAVLYCRSSNRCGGILALRAYWVQGKSAQEALAIGERAGMTRTGAIVRSLIDS